jgi:hypothetical protein
LPPAACRPADLRLEASSGPAQDAPQHRPLRTNSAAAPASPAPTSCRPRPRRRRGRQATSIVSRHQVRTRVHPVGEATVGRLPAGWAGDARFDVARYVQLHAVGRHLHGERQLREGRDRVPERGLRGAGDDRLRMHERRRVDLSRRLEERPEELEVRGARRAAPDDDRGAVGQRRACRYASRPLLIPGR